MKYHVDIYMPATLRALAVATLAHHARNFRVAHHVYDRAQEKGFLVPARLPIDAKLIEVTTEAGSFVKALFRAEYNMTDDFVFSLSRTGLVMTGWFNSKSDTHRTLDASAYARRPE